MPSSWLHNLRGEPARSGCSPAVGGMADMRGRRLPSNHPDGRIALAKPRRVATRARGSRIDQAAGSPLVSVAISAQMRARGAPCGGGRLCAASHLENAWSRAARVHDRTRRMAPEVRSCLHTACRTPDRAAGRRPLIRRPVWPSGSAAEAPLGSGAPRDMLGLDGVPGHLCSRPFGNDAGGRFRSRISTDSHGAAFVRGFAWRSSAM